MEKISQLLNLPFMSLEERQRYYDDGLRRIIKYAYRNAPAVKKKLDSAGVKPSDIQCRRDLEKIPVTTKGELIRLQEANPPFGGFLTVPLERLERIFVSPGPIYDSFDFKEHAQILAMALAGLGLKKGDRVMNTSSYHLVPAGLNQDAAIRFLGATVIPTGVGNTELQVKVMRDLKVTGYIGSPSFLNTLIKKAEELGYNFRRDFCLRYASIGGEMLPPSLRKSFEEDYGLQVREGYGTADFGTLSYECEQKAGMHMVERRIIEIVDPVTRKQLPQGETGEIVVTTFDRVRPLVRLGTGDLSYCNEEPCACGRTSPRLMRIVGRVGEAARIRNMFVYPKQIEQVVAKFPQVTKFQLVVDQAQQRDIITLKLELRAGVTATEELSQDIQKSFPEICTLKVDGIDFLAPGTIPAGSKIIVDQRTWK